MVRPPSQEDCEAGKVGGGGGGGGGGMGGDGGGVVREEVGVEKLLSSYIIPGSD